MLDLWYQIKSPIWQQWPMKSWPAVKYPGFGDDPITGSHVNGFMSYGREFIRDELLEEMNRIGLSFGTFNIFYTTPNTALPIHVDGFLNFKEINQETWF